MGGRRSIAELVNDGVPRLRCDWGELGVGAQGTRRRATLTVEARTGTESMLCSRVMRWLMRIVGLGLLLGGIAVLLGSTAVPAGVSLIALGSLLAACSLVTCGPPRCRRSIEILIEPDGVHGNEGLFWYIAEQLDLVNAAPAGDPVHQLAWDHAYDMLDPHAVHTPPAGA